MSRKTAIVRRVINCDDHAKARRTIIERNTIISALHKAKIE